MRKWWIVLKRAGIRFSNGGCGFLAQAIAFNALFAIFPLVLIAAAALGYIYGTAEAQERAFGLLQSLPPQAQAILADQLHRAVAFRGLSGFIGFITLAWSGKNLFGALAFALDRSLEVKQGRPFLQSIVLSIIMLPIVGTLLVVATVLPVALSFLVHKGILPKEFSATQVAGYLTSFVMICIGTAIMYRYLPMKCISIRYAIPGAIFAAFAFEIVQIGFTIYSVHVDFAQVYGTVSTIVALLLWFYLTGMIFLFGAQVAAEWADEQNAVKAAPLEGPAPAVEQTA